MSWLAAVEIGPLGIQVQGSVPGMMNAPMLSGRVRDVLQVHAATIPLDRAG